NSEVGHMNIGAGRVVYQDLVKINKSIREGDFFKEQTLINAISYAQQHGSKIHILGLVSDGGVHSSLDHLFALIDFLSNQSISENKLFIHAITDGRDCDPKSGLRHFEKLNQHLVNKPIKIASIIGRYFAMDRDKRWERI